MLPTSTCIYRILRKASVHRQGVDEVNIDSMFIRDGECQRCFFKMSRGFSASPNCENGHYHVRFPQSLRSDAFLTVFTGVGNADILPQHPHARTIT